MEKETPLAYKVQLHNKLCDRNFLRNHGLHWTSNDLNSNKNLSTTDCVYSRVHGLGDSNIGAASSPSCFVAGVFTCQFSFYHLSFSLSPGLSSK